MKFEINYSTVFYNEEIIEAETEAEAIEKFNEECNNYELGDDMDTIIGHIEVTK